MVDLDALVTRVIPPSDSESDDARQKWRATLEHLSRFGKCSEGNNISLYEGGEATLEMMLEAIDSARDRVWLEKYIFDGSKVAGAFVEALKRAARRGVDVVLVVDWLGSFEMRPSWIRQLRREGVPVVLFNPLVGSRSIGPWAFRDHRKILIVDKVGFVGSINVSSDSAGARWGGREHFYDVHAKLEGPAVAHLADVFRDTLQSSYSGVLRDPIAPPTSPLPAGEGAYVQILDTNVTKGRRNVQQVLERIVREADSHICVSTSYFVPPGFLRRALQHAARRGVNLSLLLSGNSDIPGDVRASTHLAGKFLKIPGAEMYFSQKQHMHAKHLTVDGVWGSVGSYNWDRHSSRRNLEVVLSVFNRDVAGELERLHKKKIKEDSKPFTLRDWKNRPLFMKVYDGLAYWAVKMSGKNLLDGFANKGRRVTVLESFLEERAGQHLASGMIWGCQ
uniref:PLD phosphodiesterase domain-containing protein n=1 Tax=Chromera velia CCMP2878 TaxID=1169474 RepID=A0A0G4HJ33_9ALVE|mmetsp:Transcript_54812/g.107238  ORF Transcript_54812/g.107238 Transcript_54812/m.107238 type:complete len:448 (-) Transcript_54812:90-1433(-)|eukprot:Cvel_1086.t1-p1 / transcript=Cvel_1086.t1 / gene=Cvel_1086 / organism=Chromera_velia_CCMP2878 / gene_product=Cardiolipin synthase 1, putative / transcript_product=Cardiolipin synthase 1, putative / location=Cvel_scaffold35:75634-81812(+) / protein_length=447 / sequence_SO=supercontig / SO=protein_coding / is_pseudo=false